MKINLSFRLRVAIMAILSTCTLLSAVLWVTQHQVVSIAREEMRTETCIQARRMAAIVRPISPLENLEQGLLSRMKLASKDQLMLIWKSNSSSAAWKSEIWPKNFDPEKLDWKELPARPQDRIVTTKGEISNIPCYQVEFHIEDPVQGGNWLAARANADGYGFVAANLRGVREATWSGLLYPVIFYAAPAALVLTLLSAWLLSAYTMRPVNLLRAAMKKIDQTALGQPLQIRRLAPEFQDLISAYNEMLKRLELSFQQANRFSADAAHELKTPLTILQGQIEQALISTVEPRQQQLLSGLQEEVAHLSAITRKLLVLSQADAGHLVLDRKTVNWSELLESILSDAVLFVDGRKFTITIEPKLQVMGDAILLHQLCNNLIINAVHHGREASWILVSAQASAGGVETVFGNSCEPISEEDRLRFFDRFYRGDMVRDKGTNGSGLGLSLAREIARAHGGDLMLLSSAEDVVTLRLWLPGE